MSDSPEKAARGILDQFWGDRLAPVDPVTISRQMGLDVQQAQLPDEISGALFKSAGKDPVIYIEERDSRSRRRFTCAHELGHYVYRSDHGEDEYEWVDLRGSLSAEGSSPEEIFANTFAASLLMPKDPVQKIYDKKMPIAVLAAHFGVSAEAISYRLAALGLGR